MTTLETELAYTRETLQATIEELETSNEEMQATNEELVASNEELQSTNEELHSVSEELYTVNAEHQQHIAELTRAQHRHPHLLEGTDVGTVFLDRDLRIRRFTSRIARRVPVHAAGRRPATSATSRTSSGRTRSRRSSAVGSEGSRIEDEVRDRGRRRTSCGSCRTAPRTAAAAGVSAA